MDANESKIVVYRCINVPSLITRPSTRMSARMTYKIPMEGSWSALPQAKMLPVERVPIGLSSSANSSFSSVCSFCSSSRISGSGVHANWIKVGSRVERRIYCFVPVDAAALRSQCCELKTGREQAHTLLLDTGVLQEVRVLLADILVRRHRLQLHELHAKRRPEYLVRKWEYTVKRARARPKDCRSSLNTGGKETPTSIPRAHLSL